MRAWAGLAEVLVKIIGQKMPIGDSFNTGRLYADVKSGDISYDGNCSSLLTSTQPSIPPGSVNDYQLWLEGQRQLVDEMQGVQVRL